MVSSATFAVKINCMETLTFVNWLPERLKKPLPGRVAQNRMSSKKRIRELLSVVSSGDEHVAGVLLLLYPNHGKLTTVLMQRTQYDGVHSGQISFPGGKREMIDETILDTALREAKEEIGINPAGIRLLGTLSTLYIPPSNFLVTPVVGFCARRPDFQLEPSEVESLLEIDVDQLTRPGIIQHKEVILSNGLSLEVPSYYIDQKIIWGATAMILSEFLELIGEWLSKSENSALNYL
jgi:8-oxo-dGTP pyrophosphatase MutT (NUDIX family)